MISTMTLLRFFLKPVDGVTKLLNSIFALLHLSFHVFRALFGSLAL
jgi:hypothetical protein